MLSVVIQAKFRPNRDILDDGWAERNGVDLEVFQNKMGKALPSPNPNSKHLLFVYFVILDCS